MEEMGRETKVNAEETSRNLLIKGVLIREIWDIEARLQKTRQNLKEEVREPAPFFGAVHKGADQNSCRGDVPSKILETLKNRLDRCQKTLKALVDGTYDGRCEGCGNQIPLERILIQPETQLCVSCQDEEDARAK